ncbi:MAG: tRNA (adenosine(37)-N6)-dimethylallyltransferase MiaA [Firmicutes bacterium]|nr:tRNA (adenosine(37)-N6)-dimethylallyltransferase MiaA [Bacillota bacterium]
MEDIIVIVGPTGVGKTKLSTSLAKMLDAEIINGDSVAIYNKLDIGSAKPTIEEREGIVHHLIDIRDVCEEYSVFDYQNDVRDLIKDITARGKRVVIVGGTGLYIKAALYNYEFTEGTIYNNYDDLSNSEILNKIHEYNENIDIHVNNRHRLVRVLNKLENDEVISDKKDELLYPCRIIGLTTDRDYLYERINKRVDAMINNGLVDEVNSLKDYYKTSRVLNSAIGYKEFYDYLFNNETIENVIEKIKLDSRRYAKRQYTFFKHQFDTKWFDVNFEDFNQTVLDVYNYIKK